MSGTARWIALAEGILTTVLVGSTLVVAKLALRFLGPLTVADLRYGLAFLVLCPWLARQRGVAWRSPRLWRQFLAIGLSFYVVGNGALFLGVKYLPATTASLLLSFVPLLVLAASWAGLADAPTRQQLLGGLIIVGGSALFFAPGLGPGQPIGLLIVTVGLLGNASFGLFGRTLAHEEDVPTIVLTAVPLAIGGVVLFPIALGVEGWPHLTLRGGAVLLWLALAHTAAVYLLYNHALRTLTAVEMSALLGLSPLVTAAGAWLLLGQRLAALQLVSMVIVVTGAVLVQWRTPTHGEASHTHAEQSSPSHQ